jgi:hypothetical protein
MIFEIEDIVKILFDKILENFFSEKAGEYCLTKF